MPDRDPEHQPERVRRFASKQRMPAGAGEKKGAKPPDAAPGQCVWRPKREWRPRAVQRGGEEDDEGGEPHQTGFRKNLQKIVMRIFMLRRGGERAGEGERG